MASLAGLLQLQGHRITGSDKAAYPPMSDLLRSLGIPILETFAESNLDPAPDLVVIGNALSRGNPEVEYVLDHRLPFTSMAALVREEFLTGRESLVIAATCAFAYVVSATSGRLQSSVTSMPFSASFS